MMRIFLTIMTIFYRHSKGAAKEVGGLDVYFKRMMKKSHFYETKNLLIKMAYGNNIFLIRTFEVVNV